MNFLDFANNLTQLFLGILAIAGLSFAAYKFLRPSVRISILSVYDSHPKDKKTNFIFKVMVDSSTDLVVKDILVYAIQKGESTALEPFNVRWKSFLPVLNDLQGRGAFYKLNGPIEPKLQVQGIKSGVNEYYICLKSIKEFKYVAIDSWKLEIKTTSPLAFAPQFLTKRSLKFDIAHPDGKNMDFDDSFLIRINEEERNQIINQL